MKLSVKCSYSGSSWVAAFHERRDFSSGPVASPLRAAQNLAAKLSELPIVLGSADTEENRDDALYQYGITVRHSNSTQDEEVFTVELP